MAPVKIKHVVSFSSQDPKYPVESLLCDGSVRPWLCCPRDRSGQLKVELQLERVSSIGYIDVGNCGCAFIQIEVARSSWSLDKPYVMLIPSTTLMTPVDSKLGKNRTGVRMFKEEDFLSPAVTEKWDRIRITCSQPFNKHAQFGLSFFRIRTPLDDNGSETDSTQLCPTRVPSEKAEPTSSPWLSNPAIQRTFFTEAQIESPSEQQLKNRLQQMDPGSAPRLGNQVCLSRTARMVISAAQSRSSRTLPPQTGASPPASNKRPSSGAENVEEPRNHDNNLSITGPVDVVTQAASPQVTTTTARSRKRCRPHESMTRSPASGSEESVLKRRRQQPAKPQGGALRHKLQERSEGNNIASPCPICGVLFSNSYLPLHASTCGDDWHGDEAVPEDEEPVIIEHLSSSPIESSSLVPCPLCEFHFSIREIERHASTCGEQRETIESSSPWIWVD